MQRGGDPAAHLLAAENATRPCVHQAQPGPLRDQAQRQGAEREGAALRRPGGGRKGRRAGARHYKKKWSSKIKVFLLQKYAQGVEIAVGAFFNGSDFVEPININFEHKRLFPNDIGPSTGEMGTSTFWVKPNFVFDATLGKMREQLRASKYVGYIDINCIANGKGVWPLEWTCFDDVTEILTREGWKTCHEVRVGDETLGINPANRELCWKRITNKMVRNYSGEMVGIGARAKLTRLCSAAVYSAAPGPRRSGWTPESIRAGLYPGSTRRRWSGREPSKARPQPP